MAETYYRIKLSTLTEIGDAIRAKSGATGDIAVTNLATSILNLSPADGADEWDGTGIVIAPIAKPTITINGTIYNAYEGQTWFSWANNLDYNTDNFRCLTEDGKVFEAESKNYVIDSNENAVTGGDLIVIGGVYRIKEVVAEDELAGTWFLNTNIAHVPSYVTFSVQGSFNAMPDSSSTYIDAYSLARIQLAPSTSNYACIIYADGYEVINYCANRFYNGNYIRADDEMELYQSVDKDSALGLELRTFTITSKLSEVTNGAALLTWLKANATKQHNHSGGPD